ncbi:GTP-binding protein REM 1-like [Sycon ciliatum]|uniref:GTP-binding protein REM 1-like n=1 Tax=Sycon ciliatum TaxID=27933 RepID=UPI0031F63FC5
MLQRSSKLSPTPMLAPSPSMVSAGGEDSRAIARRKRKESSHDVIVLGDKSVGKSALVVQLMTHKFIHDYDSSGDLLYHKDVHVGDHATKLGIWDVVSNDTVADSPAILEDSCDASGVLLVYSVADRASFRRAADMKKSIDRWQTQHRQDDSSEIPVVLVGNKADSMNGRQVSTREGELLAQQTGCHSFREVSALAGHHGVSEVFAELVMHMRSCRMDKQPTTATTWKSERSASLDPKHTQAGTAAAAASAAAAAAAAAGRRYTMISPTTGARQTTGSLPKSSSFDELASRQYAESYYNNTHAVAVTRGTEGNSLTNFIRTSLNALKSLTPRSSPSPSPRSTPRPSPRTSPRPSPMTSPRPSPRSSPRPSPRTSPRPSPFNSPRVSIETGSSVSGCQDISIRALQSQQCNQQNLHQHPRREQLVPSEPGQAAQGPGSTDGYGVVRKVARVAGDGQYRFTLQADV